MSPLEMKGFFGMAQVIGAKSLGVVLLTSAFDDWPPPTFGKLCIADRRKKSSVLMVNSTIQEFFSRENLQE